MKRKYNTKANDVNKIYAPFITSVQNLDPDLWIPAGVAES
jgi:hypothetical protein